MENEEDLGEKWRKGTLTEKDILNCDHDFEKKGRLPPKCNKCQKPKWEVEEIEERAKNKKLSEFGDSE